MRHDDEIQQGATFYRVVKLFQDRERTIPMNLTNHTPVSTLMLEDGSHVASFSCGVLNVELGHIAWSMPKAITSTVEGVTYIHNIDLVLPDGEVERWVEGTITVRRGRK